jgi:hypothetical protein
MKTVRRKARRKPMNGREKGPASPHLLGENPGTSTSPPRESRVRALIEATIDLAERLMTEWYQRRGHQPGELRIYTIGDLREEILERFHHDPLRDHLLALAADDLRKVEVVMYVGRDGGAVLDRAVTLLLTPPKQTAERIAEKDAALAQYLRAGLRAVEEQGVNLDAPWPSPRP